MLVSEAKRILREYPLTRGAYASTAQQWRSLCIHVAQRAFGRYHTATRFDRLFASTEDPWGYRDDPLSYERRRLVVGALHHTIYDRMLEIGCAEGWMTPLLSSRANKLTAVDISAVALERARHRCRLIQNVDFLRLDVMKDPLPGIFDVIVCAGVLVFLPLSEQIRIRDQVVATLPTGGDLLLEHARRAYPGQVAGDTIHAFYRAHPKLIGLRHEERDNYAISVFRRVAG